MEIKAWALNYLKTGILNVQEGQKVVEKSKRNCSRNFPAYNVLIDIAEKEKDADNALHWYKEVCKKVSGAFPEMPRSPVLLQTSILTKP
ncbi:MAG: hypothetical protein FJ264_11940 [Planctomycetes bacterium]|nr:hypothetical protein [Planctomycetota bacterium]